MTRTNLLMEITWRPFTRGDVVELINLISVRISHRSNQGLFTFTGFFRLILCRRYAFRTYLLTSVIRIRIRRGRFRTNVLTFRISPATGAERRNVPSFTQRIKDFQWPRVAFFCRVGLIYTVRGDEVFAFLFTIITTCASVVVAKWYFFRVFRLVGGTLLHTRGVRVIMLRCLNGSQMALSPAISIS